MESYKEKLKKEKLKSKKEKMSHEKIKDMFNFLDSLVIQNDNCLKETKELYKKLIDNF